MCGAVPMPSPRAARMQPTMPLYAWDEKAPGAVWAADVPLPCHRSARLTEPGPSFSKPPTVVHAARAGQATAGWEMSCAAGSNGVGWMRHLVPFQRSARLCTIPVAECCSPVVVQADGEVQDTPPR